MSIEFTINQKKEENTKIAAIEGAPFSGKTTLIKELNQQFGVKLVHEYLQYVNSRKDLPTFPSNTYEDAKKSFQVFIDLEKRRCDEAINLAATSSMPVIMDRSLISCIVFQKAVEIINPEFPSVYAYSLEAFYNVYEKGQIFFPQVLVYIQPPSYTDFCTRVEKRGASPIKMFNTYQCGKIMELWYKHCIKTCFSDSNSLILPSNQGQIQKNIDFISAFLLKEADYTKNPFITIPNLKDY